MEPIMIKNFDTSDLFISDPYLSNYGLTLANCRDCRDSQEPTNNQNRWRIQGLYK